MADAKISALTSASTPLAGTEVVPIVQSSTTKKVSVANLTSGRAVNMDSLTVGSTSSATYGSKLRVDGGIETFSSQYNIALGINTPYEFINRTTGGGFEFYVNAAGKRSVQFLSAGDVSITDNLVIGTAGKGIDFSADGQAAGMTSELLDDYEEGTWTPVPVPTSGAYTTVTASGSYVKVGRTITVSFDIVFNNTGTATDCDVVQGLPFAANNVGSQSGSGAFREYARTGDAWTMTALAGTSEFITRTYGNGKNVISNDRFTGSFTYLTS